jgi:phosphonopyruvate decarboxylase
MITRDDALRLVVSAANERNAVVFVGNGYNARALCAIADQPRFFYMVGSMGLCPTLAAGFSHCARVPVIAVEGDGNSLMGLSGYPVAATAARGPFVHLVLDNGSYETTGGQATLSAQVRFDAVAVAAGYDRAHHPADLESLRETLAVALQASQRTFICVSTALTTDPAHGRVPYLPEEITGRFREAVMT